MTFPFNNPPQFENTPTDLYAVMMSPFIVYANGYHATRIVRSLANYIQQQDLVGDIIMYKHECKYIKINEFLPFVIGVN